jgi:hypothetical protein
VLELVLLTVILTAFFCVFSMTAWETFTLALAKGLFPLCAKSGLISIARNVARI